MQWFARILQQEGIPFDTASSAPGRGNIWARLKGGTEPAVMLLHHMDVVPADPRYWDDDPYAAEVRNGDTSAAARRTKCSASRTFRRSSHCIACACPSTATSSSWRPRTKKRAAR
jgi:hypothetical protein